MPDLIAQGPRSQDRWRRALPMPDSEERVTLGRTSSGWAVPWDDRVSREHADIEWSGTLLTVTRKLNARNPIFYKGVRKDQFQVSVGDHFVIGQTTFSLVDQRIRLVAPGDSFPAVTEHTFAASQLRQARYRDADSRIEVLSRLPEIIQGSSTDNELFRRMVNLLVEGIPRASFIAIVAEPTSKPVNITTNDESASGSQAGKLKLSQYQSESDGDARVTQDATIFKAEAKSEEMIASTIHGDSGWSRSASGREVGGLSESIDGQQLDQGIRVLHWDSRNLVGQQFSPSAGLIRKSLTSGESVLHVWSRTNPRSDSSYTQTENIDWAFCTPLRSEACPGWAIYVAGDFSGPMLGPNAARDATIALADDVEDDLKFTELVATTLGSLRQTRLLQRRQDSLRPFFAPVVRQALSNRDPDVVLTPREANVSVLFCDLRGFSKQSEESAEHLLELLRRVSDALGVMTHHILARDGVVGDFHGDAAMGFWGWPFEDAKSVVSAAHAALAIQAEFEAASVIGDHPLAGFRAGLGIATGKVVAGRIGTVDQVKVTVFGPVVNLAARLESMTKQLRASILIDEVTAERVRKEIPTSAARVRRVARVLPVGMRTPLMVSELLPPEGDRSVLTDAHIEAYEHALEALHAGKWSEAFNWLHRVPAEDRVKDFLTVFIAQHGRMPPNDWQGFIKLLEK
jgi:adenylate cyclase